MGLDIFSGSRCYSADAGDGFLAVRFGVAAIFMLAIRPNCLRGMKSAGYVRGIILGILLGLGYILQTFGLQYTSATVSGFIPGCR